jgi:hypothetical protein
MSAYTNHAKTTLAKWKSGRSSTLTERDRRALRRAVSKSHNYCSTDDRTAELNIHLEDPVLTKTVQHELHTSHIHCMDAIAKPLLTENNAQMRKPWYHDHKTWISDNQTTGNA